MKKREIEIYSIEEITLPVLKPVEYTNTPEERKKIAYGRYLVVRRDGKRHFEIFNRTGWAYNNNSIVAYYEPKID